MSLGRRALANTIATWIGLGAATLASLFLTPYLIQYLPDERFGIYVISRQLITYFALFDLGILVSVMRFSSQAIASNDHPRLNTLTNSALVLFSGIALAGLLFSALVAVRGPEFFRVDAAHADEARWLFLGIGCRWALTMLAYPARGILVGHQRFGLLSVVTAGSWVVTVAAVVGLFEIGYVNLGAVSLAFVAGGVFQALASNTIAGRIQPTLRWSWRYVNWATLRMLCVFGMWNMLFEVAGLFLWSTDSIIIGRLLGLEFVPMFAIPFMLVRYGRVVLFGFSRQMTPIAAGHMVRNDTARLQNTLVRSTRIGLILTLAGNGMLIVLAEDLLRLWVGPAYAGTWIVYAYLMLSFWAVYAQMPIHQILLGAGDIRLPAILVLLAASATLVLKIVALKWFDIGVEGVALLTCVFVLPAMLLAVPWWACRTVELPLLRLYREAYLGPLLAFVPVAGLGWLLSRHLSPMTLIEFVVCFGLLALTYLLAAMWTLSSSERAAVARLLKNPTLALQRTKTAASS